MKGKLQLDGIFPGRSSLPAKRVVKQDFFLHARVLDGEISSDGGLQ
jgi:hypothetical protein